MLDDQFISDDAAEGDVGIFRKDFFLHLVAAENLFVGNGSVDCFFDVTELPAKPPTEAAMFCRLGRDHYSVAVVGACAVGNNVGGVYHRSMNVRTA